MQYFPDLETTDKELWEKIYTNAFEYYRETFIQSLQIINCNKQLYNWKILDNPKCNYCHKEDDILH